MLKSKAVWLNGLLIAGFLLWALFQFISAPAVVDHMITLARRVFWAFYTEYHDDLVSPVFYLPFALVAALEVIMPAVAYHGRKAVLDVKAASTRLDFLYTFFDRPFRLLVMLPYVAYLSYLYHQVWGGPTFQARADLPGWLVALLLFLLVDFTGWFHHLLRHKIAAIWQFHAVHHSTRFFSIFSRNRIHPVDVIFSEHIKFLPLLYFQQFFGVVAVFYMFKLTVDLFAHSNIRTNFGPLRYILVSPQSHRIHHSFLPQHLDRNFGVTLSIWDYIFATQYRKYDEYPDIGIEDPAYPHEQGLAPGQVFKTFAGQMLYPAGVVLGRPPVAARLAAE